ncbi:MAG: DUF2251 domain-containing protein [Planctomycetota bacterium]
MPALPPDLAPVFGLAALAAVPAVVAGPKKYRLLGIVAFLLAVCLVGLQLQQGKRNRDRAEMPDEAIAHPIVFSGPGPYAKSLDAKCGVVFEDDGETGYFYATDSGGTTIFDALHLYDRQDNDRLRQGEEVFVVWNPGRQRAAIFYHDQFQAVFDFTARRGACRTGFPPSKGKGWSADGHAWDESLTMGLEPE